jgi:O-acetyl-ADP-ribose deacetylase (regulator of RNase III)
MWRYVERHLIEVVANPCNCVGVSGRGISRQVMDRWPELESQYKWACRNGLRPGMLALHWPTTGPGSLLFPTKDHWRNPSRYEYIQGGLEKLADNWERLEIQSILIPPLGCGLGRLEWSKVRQMIHTHLNHLNGVHVLEQKGS